MFLGYLGGMIFAILGGCAINSLPNVFLHVHRVRQRPNSSCEVDWPWVRFAGHVEVRDKAARLPLHFGGHGPAVRTMTYITFVKDSNAGI